MRKLILNSGMFLLFLSDIAISFLALLLVLIIRYGELYGQYLNNHAIPFLIISLLFVLIFYIFNIYSPRFNRNITDFTSSFIKSIIIAFSISVLIFYVFGEFFKLTPKTNLLLFTAFFSFLSFYFKVKIKRFFNKNGFSKKIFLIFENEDNLIKEIKENNNAGYTITAEEKKIDIEKIIKTKPDIVVLDVINEKMAVDLFEISNNNILVYSTKNFYEETFQKIAIEEKESMEIINSILKSKSVYNSLKRVMDLFLSFFMFIILIPIFLLISFIIKATSKGPIFFKHKRISLNGKSFIIYKFRSMYVDAEKNGPVWTKDNKTDTRITSVGRFLRNTHLDEIPQLINILKGDLSFVGPRPERPEFIKELNEAIPLYNIRHSTKAGLTGWAQVNYKYGSSIEDAKEKLKYDFYYLKNRSVFFDILIMLKTVAKIFNY